MLAAMYSDALNFLADPSEEIYTLEDGILYTEASA